MALPESIRKNIRDNAVSCLQAVRKSAEYRHTLQVETGFRALHQVAPSECPVVMVAMGDGGADAQVSSTNSETVELMVLGYVKPDPDRWPGVSCADLLEEVLPDVYKALDSSPYRDGTARNRQRRTDVVHDVQGGGAWSVFLITDTYTFKRRF